MVRAKLKNKIFLSLLTLRDGRAKILLVHFFFLFGGKKHCRLGFPPQHSVHCSLARVNDTFRFGKNLENRRYRGFHPNELFGENENLSFVNQQSRTPKPFGLFRIGRFPHYLNGFTVRHRMTNLAKRTKNFRLTTKRYAEQSSSGFFGLANFRIVLNGFTSRN